MFDRSHILTRQQIIKADIKDVWAFFSNPANLSLITPPSMNFQVVSELGEQVREGQIIEYRVKPLPGLRMKWVSRISKLIPNKSFTDVQLQGPYKLWRHHHVFKEVEQGVEMTDTIEYALSFWPLGNLLLPVIKHRLSFIFNYRYKFVESYFNK